MAEVLQVRALAAGRRVAESDKAKGLLRGENVLGLAGQGDHFETALLIVLVGEAPAAGHCNSRNLKINATKLGDFSLN
jgi:hypothetical protein